MKTCSHLSMHYLFANFKFCMSTLPCIAYIHYAFDHRIIENNAGISFESSS